MVLNLNATNDQKNDCCKNCNKHAATVHAITTNATIAINTTIIVIDTTMISVLATDTTIKMSATIAMIVIRIPHAIADHKDHKHNQSNCDRKTNSYP